MNGLIIGSTNRSTLISVQTNLNLRSFQYSDAQNFEFPSLEFIEQRKKNLLEQTEPKNKKQGKKDSNSDSDDESDDEMEEDSDDSDAQFEKERKFWSLLSHPNGLFDINDPNDKKFETFIAPEFVRNCFVDNYTSDFKAREIAKMPLDHPIASINDDLLSDGPSGVGGEAKQRFLKSLLSIFQDDSFGLNSIKVFSAVCTLSNWDAFKENLVTLTKILNSHIINAIAIGCRSFQANHFQELIQILKQTFIQSTSPSSSHFISLLSNFPGHNLKLICSLLSDDSFFWFDFEKVHHSNLKFLLNCWDDIFRKLEIRNDVTSLTELISTLSKLSGDPNSDILKLRAIQTAILKLFLNSNVSPVRLCEQFLSIMKEMTPYVSKNNNNNHNEQQTSIHFKQTCQVLSNHLFNLLNHFIHFNDLISNVYFKIWKPANADEIFRNLVNVFSDPSTELLGISLNEDNFDILCGVYATPELLESMFFSNSEQIVVGSFKFRVLKSILEHCIPPNPFPLKKPATEFSKWMLNDKEVEFETRRSFPWFDSFEDFRYFEYNMEDEKYLKRFLPYLELKKQIEEKLEKNNSSESQGERKAKRQKTNK